MPPEKPSLVAQMLMSWLTLLLLFGVWVWFMRRNMGGGGGPGNLLGFGKSRAKQHAEGDVKVTLRDVAGVEESARTAESIDTEIRAIIDRNYRRTQALLDAHEDKLHAMAEALMRFETLDIDQIGDLMADRPVRPLEDSGNDAGGLVSFRGT